MIQLSETALKELEAYFTDHAREPIRVYLAPGGCSGPRLALALDKPGEDDVTAEQGGFTFCINKALFEKVGNVSIDMGGMGFTIVTEIPLPAPAGGGCSGCGSSSSCCS